MNVFAKTAKAVSNAKEMENVPLGAIYFVLEDVLNNIYTKTLAMTGRASMDKWAKEGDWDAFCAFPPANCADSVRRCNYNIAKCAAAWPLFPGKSWEWVLNEVQKTDKQGKEHSLKFWVNKRVMREVKGEVDSFKAQTITFVDAKASAAAVKVVGIKVPPSKGVVPCVAPPEEFLSAEAFWALYNNNVRAVIPAPTAPFPAAYNNSSASVLEPQAPAAASAARAATGPVLFSMELLGENWGDLVDEE